MPQILEQRVSVNSHERNHCQRNQGHCHDYDTNSGRHRDPLKLRIPYQHHKGDCLDGVSGFHHAAEQFARIRVVRRDGIDVAVFLFFHMR